MTPLGLVLIYCALIVVTVRGPLVVDPEGHARRLERWFFSSDERMRRVGMGMVVALAAPLLVVARAAPEAQPGRGPVEALGWLVLAGGVFVVAAPGPARRLIDRVMTAIDPFALRVVGLLNVAFGAFLVWAAFAIS